MRRPALLLLLLAVTLPGCSGFGVGVRQDRDEREALTARLAGARAGDRFPARELLEGAWTRLFVFAPGAETQAIEDRIGIPFPFSEERAREDGEYLVFVDAEEVVAAFTFEGPPGVDAACLRAGRGPLLPETGLTLRAAGSGRGRLTTLTGAGRCG